MTRTITMMSVSAILQGAKGSLDLGGYGELDWFAVLAAKVSHAHFDELTDTIEREGFLLPIVLVGDSADGYTIGNGHHRLCAAILLGLSAIPVIVNDEGDYWAFEDSHDGEWNPGERSFDYWNLLKGNIPDGYYGDEGNEVHRDQFNPGDSACSECGYIDCECCPECDTNPCQCDYCGECESGDCMCERVTPLLLGIYGWKYIRCLNCREWGQRIDHLACDIPNVWDEAHAENARRIPAGAWHPVRVLVDAYAEHAEWLADEPMRQARANWEAAIMQMRAAVDNGYADILISILAGKIREAWDAYESLQ